MLAAALFASASASVTWPYPENAPLFFFADVFTEKAFVFKAIFLNRNYFLAIIGAKFVGNNVTFDQKHSFLHYFNYVSE